MYNGKHDVFVSYSHDDARWVDDRLFPEFDRHQIDFISDKRFHVGAPVGLTIEQSISRCRHVAFVLTPNWIASEWANLELAMAEQLDPDGRRGVILPLLVKACDIPLRLSTRVWVDLSDEPRFATDFPRLVFTIHSSRNSEAATALEADLTPVVAAPAVDGLEAMAAITRRDPAVAAAALKFGVHLATSSRQIDALGDLKNMHDELQRLQCIFSAVVRREIALLDGASDLWGIRVYETRFAESLERLRGLVAKENTSVRDRSFVERLSGLYTDLCSSIVAADITALKDVLDDLDVALPPHGDYVNTRLITAAGAIHFAELIDAVATVCEHPSAPSHAEFGHLQEGFKALVRLARNVSALIADHDRWQGVDRDLWLLKLSAQRSVEHVRRNWAIVERGVVEILKTNPFVDEARVRVKAAIEHSNHAMVGESLSALCDYFTSRFSTVDYTLKCQCEELRHIAAPLAVLSTELSA